MFSAAQYLQGAKTSSFLIRDILGADGTITSAAKYAGLDPGLVGMPGQAYLGQPFSSAQSLAPYQNSLCYQDVRRAAYSIDSLLEPNFKDSSPSIPIPLPVYIRTRSPPGSDVFGKAKRCRRSRTVFTELQLMGLEKRFDDQKYLSTPDRMDLADSLGLTQLQVKTWYQNRRMKWKKQVLQSGCKEAPTKPKGRPKKDSCADEGGESLDTKLLNEGRQHQSDIIDTTSTGAICQVTNNVANQYAGLYQIGGVPHVT